MRIKKLILIIALVFPFMLITSVMAKRPVISEDIAIWELTKIQVVSEGQTAELAEGLFTTDYTIKARATSKNNPLISTGAFEMTLSAFTPFEQMDAQRPGYWYIQGSWTLTKDNPNREAMEAKHNSEVIEGTLIAEVPFNPTADWTNWTGLARLSMSLLGDTWTNGEGTLTFNQDNTGALFLDLTRWPEMQLETSK